MPLRDTNKVPFFRHSVYLSPFSRRDSSRAHKRGPCTHYFTLGAPENIFTVVAGTNALICAENRPSPKSRVAIKALVARLSVFPTCSRPSPFCTPPFALYCRDVLSSLSWRYINVTVFWYRQLDDFLSVFSSVEIVIVGYSHFRGRFWRISIDEKELRIV